MPSRSPCSQKALLLVADLVRVMPTEAHSDRCVLTAGQKYVNARHENRELSESHRRLHAPMRPPQSPRYVHRSSGEHLVFASRSPSASGRRIWSRRGRTQTPEISTAATRRHVVHAQRSAGRFVPRGNDSNACTDAACAGSVGLAVPQFQTAGGGSLQAGPPVNIVAGGGGVSYRYADDHSRRRSDRRLATAGRRATP